MVDASTNVADVADTIAAPEPAGSTTPRFAPGERVRTRRHGIAEVERCDAATVTLRFPNGETRSFQPQFVRAAGRRKDPSIAAKVFVDGP